MNSVWIWTHQDDSSNIWTYTVGNRVGFSGEIKNKYDDMLGLLNDENTFTNCEILNYGSIFYTPTIFGQNLQQLFWSKADSTEWQVDTINGNFVKTWDLNPQQ